VIQYILFLSTWYQSTGSESPIYYSFFFFGLFPEIFRRRRRCFRRTSSLCLPRFCLPVPVSTWFIYQSKPWETTVPEPSRTALSSHSRASTRRLKFLPPPASAAAPPSDDPTVRSFGFQHRSLDKPPSCSGTPVLSKSDGPRASTRH